ncbi:MAG: Ig-like domain-containing protein, partial [Gemmatimonadetes bacterium]|nr:Ig-like domain-containing protein [Gemmatimonadota bacterium]
MRRYWYSALLVAAAAACDKGSTDAGPRVASVSLGFDTRAVGVGQEVALSATVLDPSKKVVDDARLAWQSLNPGVASVTQEGVLRGNAVGSTQVVASAGGQADTANINVVAGVLRS